MISVFIYRPDKRNNPNVDPDLCYTLQGQQFREWLRDEETAYYYKVETIKRKLNEKPVHKIWAYDR